MKKINSLLIVLILLCIGTFYGYRTVNSLKADNEAPTIHMDSQIPEISVTDPKTTLLQGIIAKDNRDGDVTDSLVVENIELLDSEGRLQVSYAAFDQAGNVTKSQREAKYVDYRSPRFTLNGPLLYDRSSNFDVLSTVGATDVIDGEIQHRVRATSLVDHSIAELGVHDVQFQVSNSLGDTVTAVFPVQVYDEDYDAYLRLNTYLVYLPLNASFNPKDYLDGFIYMGENVALNFGLPKGYTVKTEGNLQTNNPGIYSVDIWVTHTIENELNTNLNVEHVGYSKLIVIVEG